MVAYLDNLFRKLNNVEVCLQQSTVTHSDWPKRIGRVRMGLDWLMTHKSDLKEVDPVPIPLANPENSSEVFLCERLVEHELRMAEEGGLLVDDLRKRLSQHIPQRRFVVSLLWQTYHLRFAMRRLQKKWRSISEKQNIVENYWERLAAKIPGFRGDGHERGSARDYLEECCEIDDTLQRVTELQSELLRLKTSNGLKSAWLHNAEADLRKPIEFTSPPEILSFVREKSPIEIDGKAVTPSRGRDRLVINRRRK